MFASAAAILHYHPCFLLDDPTASLRLMLAKIDVSKEWWEAVVSG